MGRLFKEGKITPAGIAVWNTLSSWLMAITGTMIAGGMDPTEVSLVIMQVARDVETKGWGIVDKLKSGQAAERITMRNGKIAYDAYCAATGGKALITGIKLPEFDALKPEVAAAWDAAAVAVGATSPLTRCKFRLMTEARHHGNEGRNYIFSCSYDSTVPEDRAFTKYTPSGEIKVTIDNPAVVAKLQVGQQYYVDFTPAPEPAKV